MPEKPSFHETLTRLGQFVTTHIVVYVVAYTARSAHSLALQGVAGNDQDAARRRLAEMRATLLDVR